MFGLLDSIIRLQTHGIKEVSYRIDMFAMIIMIRLR